MILFSKLCYFNGLIKGFYSTETTFNKKDLNIYINFIIIILTYKINKGLQAHFKLFYHQHKHSVVYHLS